MADQRRTASSPSKKTSQQNSTIMMGRSVKRSLSQDLWRQMDSLFEALEAKVGAQAVEKGVEFQRS